MKPWYSPQSRAFNELVRALRNAFAMLGFIACLLLAASWFGGK